LLALYVAYLRITVLSSLAGVIPSAQRRQKKYILAQLQVVMMQNVVELQKQFA